MGSTVGQRCPAGHYEGYDQIEIDDKESESEALTKKLYNRSLDIGFRDGELRGLTQLQKLSLIRNDYESSTKYGEAAEAIAVKINDHAALSSVYLCRGKINIILDKHPEAKQDLNQALTFANQIKNVADRHIQLCRIYANFAGMSEGLDDFPNWYRYTRKSLDIIQSTPTENLTEYQKNKYYYLYIFELVNMGTYYVYGVKPPDFRTAEKYYKEVMKFKTTAPHYFAINDIHIYYALSSFYQEKKDYDQSIEYSLELIKAERKKNEPRTRLFAFENLKEAFKHLNKPEEEAKYLRLYTALNDSINRVEKKEIVNQSRSQINKTIVKSEESKNKLLLSAIGVLLLMALILWYSIHHHRKVLRKNYEEIIARLQAQPNLPGNTSNEEMDSDDNRHYPDTEEEIGVNASQFTMSAQTETRLIRKLETFEKSGRFLKKDINIGVLAGQLGTNSRYLSEIIKNSKDQSFSSYINSLRINYIVQKLYSEPKYREYKISYLAEECGYSSPQVFVLAFKKINGVTPSYFIKSLKEDQSAAEQE